MPKKKRVRKRMYAVSLEGVGLIAGTLAYSRKDAIRHFHGGYIEPHEWNLNKADGYRTVQALVEVVGPQGRWRS